MSKCFYCSNISFIKSKSIKNRLSCKTRRCRRFYFFFFFGIDRILICATSFVSTVKSPNIFAQPIRLRSLGIPTSSQMILPVEVTTPLSGIFSLLSPMKALQRKSLPFFASGPSTESVIQTDLRFILNNFFITATLSRQIDMSK